MKGYIFIVSLLLLIFIPLIMYGDSEDKLKYKRLSEKYCNGTEIEHITYKTYYCNNVLYYCDYHLEFCDIRIKAAEKEK